MTASQPTKIASVARRLLTAVALAFCFCASAHVVVIPPVNFSSQPSKQPVIVTNLVAKTSPLMASNGIYSVSSLTISSPTNVYLGRSNCAIVTLPAGYFKAIVGEYSTVFLSYDNMTTNWLSEVSTNYTAIGNAITSIFTSSNLKAGTNTTFRTNSGIVYVDTTGGGTTSTNAITNNWAGDNLRFNAGMSVSNIFGSQNEFVVNLDDASYGLLETKIQQGPESVTLAYAGAGTPTQLSSFTVSANSLPTLYTSTNWFVTGAILHTNFWDDTVGAGGEEVFAYKQYSTNGSFLRWGISVNNSDFGGTPKFYTALGQFDAVPPRGLVWTDRDASTNAALSFTDNGTNTAHSVTVGRAGVLVDGAPLSATIGGTTYTNNSTGLPGVIDAGTSSIGTNLTSLLSQSQTNQIQNAASATALAMVQGSTNLIGQNLYATNAAFVNGVAFTNVAQAIYAANAIAPATVELIGTNNLYESVVLTNITVLQKGGLLRYYGTNSPSGSISIALVPYDNSTLDGITYQLMSTNYDQAIAGTAVSGGYPPITNATFINLTAVNNNNIDSLYLQHSTSSPGGRVINCKLSSSYDQLAFEINGGWKFENCDFEGSGGPFGLGGIDAPNGINYGGGDVHFSNCRFTASGENATNIFRTFLSSYVTGGSVIFENCTARLEQTNGLNYPYRITSGAISNITWIGGSIVASNTTRVKAGISFAPPSSAVQARISGMRIYDNSTNAQIQTGNAATGALLAYSGGNVVESRIVSANESQRGKLGYAGGDIGRTNAYVPNAFISNLTWQVASGPVTASQITGTLSAAQLASTNNITTTNDQYVLVSLNGTQQFVRVITNLAMENATLASATLTGIITNVANNITNIWRVGSTNTQLMMIAAGATNIIETRTNGTFAMRRGTAGNEIIFNPNGGPMFTSTAGGYGGGVDFGSANQGVFITGNAPGVVRGQNGGTLQLGSSANGGNDNVVSLFMTTGGKIQFGTTGQAAYLANGSLTIFTNQAPLGPTWCTNGLVSSWNSNGTAFLRTSRVAATNWSDTKLADAP